jgi:DNA (cytosine-5)-methyltransferase 1
MPEATVHKDRQPSLSEDEVGFAGESRIAHSPTLYATANQVGSQPPFRRLPMPRFDERHDPRSRLGRYPIHCLVRFLCRFFSQSNYNSSRDTLIMLKSRRPTAIDLFCGAGGLSLGFEQSGFDVVAAIDSNPINISTYSRNFPSTKAICADIFRLSGDEIRERCGLEAIEQIDVVFGGPPCQGFSAIGKRDVKDPRNALIFEFCRLVAELRPRYFVMENVAGLMYTASRSVLEHALGGLLAEAYEWVSPIRLLDAQEFGVPQRRRRVFVLGFMTSERPPEYPRPRGGGATVWEAISDLRNIRRSRMLFSSDIFLGPLGPPTAYSKKLRNDKESEGLSGCLLCQHNPSVTTRFRRTKPGRTERISRFSRLRKGAVAPTLRAGTPRSHGSFTAARPIHPTQPRCITVREAARLQSFPDRFQFHHTQWHGFQQVGNSVPPHLARAVADSVRRALVGK